MNEGFAADTLVLQEHMELLRQEQQLARRLLGHLQRARQLVLPEEAWRYDGLLRDAERLVQYFSGMGTQVDRMIQELTQLSEEIHLLMTDTAANVQRETSVFQIE